MIKSQLKAVRGLLEEDMQAEEQNAGLRSHLTLDDRKHKYSDKQLDMFIEFQTRMIQKMGVEKTEGLTDNVYCRFLDGYLFDLQEGEKHMTAFLVRNSNLIG